MRVILTEIPECPRCHAKACPEDEASTWDARKQGRWLRGVKFLRAIPTMNRTEFICMECGSEWSELGMPTNWQQCEALAQRPVQREIDAARDTRLEYDDDPEIPQEMLGDMPDMPADLGETTTVPSIKDEMAKIKELYPEKLEKAMPWQHQLKTLLESRPDLVKG